MRYKIMCGKGRVIVENNCSPYTLPVVVLPDRAIKLLHKEDYEQRREKDILELISLEGHPNVVRVFAIHDWGEHFAAEMERLYPLSYIDEEYFLYGLFDSSDTWEEALINYYSQYRRHFGVERKLGDTAISWFESFFKGVKAGVEYISSLGFLHTDLHRGNIMLSKNSVPKLIDFDIVAEY